MRLRQFPLSLKWFITLSFLSLGLLLVVGYSLLSARYFIGGMDNMLANHMQRAAETYQAQHANAPTPGYEEFNGYGMTHHWSQLPAVFADAFQSPPELPNQLYKYTGSTIGPPEKLLFLFPYQQPGQDQQAGQTLYVTFRISPQTVSELLGRNARQSFDQLLLISGVCALLLVAILVLVIRRIFRPVSELREWTRALNANALAQPAPDFSYPELNELAELIRSSLQSVQNALEREHQFLRHTSHELRTPISTIRNNIELLQKLQRSEHTLPAPLQQSLDRIDRSSLTMQHLTETLLWLSKDEQEALPTQPVRLDELIKSLVIDLHYLLRDKTVTVNLDTRPATVEVAQTAAAIVISNLIRNAFQHTWEGEVIIRQRGKQIEIRNHNLADSANGSDLGFGLGLQLTRQLCTRLGWAYQNDTTEAGHCAKLTLPS
ncbi:MAG: HAMP domain-containing sensor histidine kinase [Pseudomonadota bacterium]|nr:HAMP domain-containing sensor histidine kinase [Pseudomonadota bacterium]